jgi:ribosomal protein S18 acetylase RimI-like enzyme
VVDGERVGLLTYDRCGDDVEVVTLHVDTPGRGTGRALMDNLRDEARRTAARRIWLVTTNDNTRAIRFYQQWGMDLVALHADGVTESRRVKPSIPITGDHGIPVRHELEFELRL